VKILRYRLEAVTARLVYGLFAALPRRQASALGGVLGRLAGRVLPTVSRTADRNLQRAFPDVSADARRQMIRGVWDNIGRVAAELPHIHSCRPETDFIVEGEEILRQLAAQDKPVIFVSGHLANWEVFAHVGASCGLPMLRVYRAANNPLVEELIQKSRAHVPGGCIPKGAKGAREILRALRAGRHVGFLIDQRMSDGESVPFFGLPARTATAPVDLAIRFGCPLVAARCIRLPHSRFKVIISPPLRVTSANRQEILIHLNTELEYWIRAHPEQWLWVHKRWKGESVR
jgi:Kdo2-lipid IVA lauroyltransferase/acyltransferase